MASKIQEARDLLKRFGSNLISQAKALPQYTKQSNFVQNTIPQFKAKVASSPYLNQVADRASQNKFGTTPFSPTAIKHAVNSADMLSKYTSNISNRPNTPGPLDDITRFVAGTSSKLLGTAIYPLQWSQTGSQNIKSGVQNKDAAQILKGTGQFMAGAGSLYYGGKLLTKGGFKGVGGRAVTGGGLGLGMGTGSQLLTGGGLPTKEQATKYIQSGVENSWTLAITNALTDKVLSKIAPNLVGNALTAPFKSGQVAQGFKQVFTRALAEVPAENTAFTFLDRLDGDSQKSFMQDWLLALPGNIVTNLAFAGAQGTWNTAINKESRQAVSNALNEVARKWTTQVTTMKLDKNGKRIKMPMWEYKIKQIQPGMTTKDINELSVEDYAKVKDQITQPKGVEGEVILPSDLIKKTVKYEGGWKEILQQKSTGKEIANISSSPEAGKYWLKNGYPLTQPKGVGDAQAGMYDTKNPIISKGQTLNEVEQRIKSVKADASLSGLKTSPSTHAGFITTDGKFAAVNTGHSTTLGDLGEGELGLNKYLDAGGIRTRVAMDNGDINIEIHKQPNLEQMKTLESLPSDRRYFFDIKDITNGGMSGAAKTKGELISAIKKQFSVAQQPLSVPKGVSDTQSLNNQVAEPMSRKLTQQVDPTTKQSQIPGQLQGKQLVGGGDSNIPSSESIDPIKKITQLLTEAKPIRSQQEALYSAERSRRFGKIAGIGQRMEGEAGFYKKLGALKGELPKVEFQRIRQNLQQSDIDYLFNQIEKSNLTLGEKVTGQGALKKLLGAEGGQVPTKGEIKLLSEVFPPDMIQAILNKRPFMSRLWSGIQNALNLPRAVMSTADLSAPMRQGIFLIGRPKQWVPAFKDMFKYAFSEKSYVGLMDNIKSRPNYQLMRESKLALTDMSPQLLNREESFMSNLAEKIPVFGTIAKGSNRAYSGFLNKLRADVFDDLVNTAKKQGLKIEGKRLDDISSFVNSATGRGNLGKTMQKAAPILNATLFSPRLMASRINLLNPVTYVNYDPFVRKEALKSLLTFGGTAMTVLGLASLGGAEVQTDPRNADFGKIKVGNTRYDVLGGFQQYIRLASQLLTGKVISSTTGKTITLGEGYKPLTRKDILVRFFEAKEAPVASFITALMTGQTGVGEPVNIPTEVINRFIPMALQDIYDIAKDKDSIGQGLVMALPGIFGVGSQTYGKSEYVEGVNPVGQKTSQIRPVQGIAETISEKVFGQKPLGSTATYNAETFYKQLQSMPAQEANATVQRIKSTNKDLYDKLLQVAKDEKRQVTPEEKTLKSKSVASGDRSMAIIKELNKLNTPEEKNALIKRYTGLGIITDDVKKQLILLKKQGKI